MSPKYILTYFDIRGRAEILRMCFGAAGVEFEDRRISMENWAKIKADKKFTPLGQLPVLEVDEKKFVQSDAILRFLAREFGLYGANNIESTTIDMIVATMQEMTEGLKVKVYMEQDEKKKEEAKKKAIKEDMPQYCKLLQDILENNGGKGWMVGSKISVGDLALFAMLETIINSNEFQEVFDAVPTLMALRQRVAEHAQMKAYLEKRKPSVY